MVRKAQLVIAEIEGVAIFDLLGFDAIATEFDAVCRAEIFNIVATVMENHRAVFAGDVAIADREVCLLATATNDKLVLVDGVAVVVKNQKQRWAPADLLPEALRAKATGLRRLRLWWPWRHAAPTTSLRAWTRRGWGRTRGQTAGRGWRWRHGVAAKWVGLWTLLLTTYWWDAIEGAVIDRVLWTDVKAIHRLTKSTAATDTTAAEAVGLTKVIHWILTVCLKISAAGV